MKVVIYAAKSTQDEQGSIPTQLEDGRAMAEREGWEVVGEYQDESASAWTGNRGPGLSAALEHAEREKCGLLVQHSDRLARGDGRDARHLGEIYFWALRAGVELRSVQDDSTFTNPLLAFAMGERNAEDSRRKSLAVKAGMKRRREAGKHHGGPPAFGTAYRGGDQVPVESMVPIVRRIFAEYLAGRGQLPIARDLIADRVPTARGGKWQQATVRAILTNPVYVALGVVSEETFKKVEALRIAKTRTHVTGRNPAGLHLFRKGMLRCGECGEAMIPRTGANRVRTPYEVYLCGGRRLDTGSCSMRPVRRAEIDQAVFRYFLQVGLDVEATRRQLAEARDAKLAEVRALVTDAEREVAKLADAQDRVDRDYLAGSLAPESHDRLAARVADELQGAKAQADRLRDQEREVDSWGELQDAETETLRRLSEIRSAIAGEITDAEGVEAVRAVLSRTFERFIVHRGIPDRAHVELIGKAWIEPVPREHAIEGYTETLRPVLRREPLAANNYNVGLTT